jgi:hypothetical protein
MTSGQRYSQAQKTYIPAHRRVVDIAVGGEVEELGERLVIGVLGGHLLDHARVAVRLTLGEEVQP